MPALIRLALAQINPTVGDLAGNAALIRSFAERARGDGADLVLFPEMALTGYPPEDLLLQPRFVRAADQALRRLAVRLPRDLAVVAGTVLGRSGDLKNGAVLIHGGRVRARFEKWFLPNYGVFDEARYFTPGNTATVFDLGGVRIGLTICEDIWRAGGPARESARRGAGLILNLSASPFHAGKNQERRNVIRRAVKESRAPLAYCNMVGGQDELVYDGGSFLMDARGRVLARAPGFEENLLTVDLALSNDPHPEPPAVRLPLRRTERSSRPPLLAPSLSREEEIYSALTLATRDYAQKNGFQKAVIGLSGGIDSALVACVAADALGRDQVVGVTLPSRFNAAETRADAQTVADRLGLQFLTIPIDGIVDSFLAALGPVFAGRAADVTEENLQSRVRGTLLMALSNKFGWLVLTTGNKSETSAGYFTLYGDSAGGFAVIKDVPKTLVYDLARWRNARAGRPLIPESVLTRPPSAELRENQTDQDSLPPYAALDRLIQSYVEENREPADLARKGLDRETAAKMVRLIDRMEYKRRQAPPGVKITPRAFGRDRRMPITNGFHPDAN